MFTSSTTIIVVAQLYVCLGILTVANASEARPVVARYTLTPTEEQIIGNESRPPDNMDEIKKAFQRYDLDGNGYITTDEAHKVLEAELCFDPERTRKLIRVYDRNGDGRLSYEEFIWFYWKIQEKKDAIGQMFQKFDADRNNSVSFDEAKAILQEFGFSDQEIRDLIAIHDTNKDGLLQYDEFIHFWNACTTKVPTTK